MVIIVTTGNYLELYKIITQFVAHYQYNKKLSLSEVEILITTYNHTQTLKITFCGIIPKVENGDFDRY